MNKFLFIILLLFLGANSAFAKEVQIKFNLKFGFVKGGEAEMFISDTTFNGGPPFIITLWVKLPVWQIRFTEFTIFMKLRLTPKRIFR